MKSFKQFITEARRGGSKNARKSLLDNLRPYKDDPDEDVDGQGS